MLIQRKVTVISTHYSIFQDTFLSVVFQHIEDLLILDKRKIYVSRAVVVTASPAPLQTVLVQQPTPHQASDCQHPFQAAPMSSSGGYV